MDKDREILNKMNDKDYRTKVLDNLNGALGTALRITADDDGQTSIREYIWAVHSLQLENMQLEHENKESKEKATELENRIIDALAILMQIDYDDKNEWIPPKKIEPTIYILSGAKDNKVGNK